MHRTTGCSARLESTGSSRRRGACDIGYWLAREARGRGVMTRAVRLLSAWAFGELLVDRIEIIVDPRNASSRAVAERAGFRFEGVLRSYVVIKDRRRDMAMYSLLRTDPF